MGQLGFFDADKRLEALSAKAARWESLNSLSPARARSEAFLSGTPPVLSEGRHRRWLEACLLRRSKNEVVRSVHAADLDLEVGLVVGGDITHDEGVAAGLVVFQLALSDDLIGRAGPKEGEVLVAGNARIGVDRGEVNNIGAFPVGDHVTVSAHRTG
jgi:hypothetical protein